MNGLHSTSLGSRINCTNSSSSQIAKSPVHNSLRKNYQSSGGISGISGNLSGNFSGNSYQKSISTSPITVTTMSDGRVERRLETCSYQETEMVRFVSSSCHLDWAANDEFSDECLFWFFQPTWKSDLQVVQITKNDLFWFFQPTWKSDL